MLIRLWRPGDHIFLFGFSRGAYTVRCLAGFWRTAASPRGRAPGYEIRRRLATIAVEVYQHTASVPRVSHAAAERADGSARRARASSVKPTPHGGRIHPNTRTLSGGVRHSHFDCEHGLVDYSHYRGAGWRCPRGPVVDRLSVHRHFCRTGRLRRARARPFHPPSRPCGGRGLAVVVAVFVIAFVWYVTQQVKFAPRSDRNARGA